MCLNFKCSACKIQDVLKASPTSGIIWLNFQVGANNSAGMNQNWSITSITGYKRQSRSITWVFCMTSDWCDASHSFVSSIATVLPMFLVLAYMYTVCQTIKGLVLEKELRLKEVLRVVGVRNGALWFSWFTENIVLLMVPCTLISIMLKVSVSIDESQSKTNQNQTEMCINQRISNQLIH